jgi:hypothetical protein
MRSRDEEADDAKGRLVDTICDVVISTVLFLVAMCIPSISGRAVAEAFLWYVTARGAYYLFKLWRLS